MAHDWITVRGARVHNLKNIDVDLPRDRMVVITGLSGSGSREGERNLGLQTLWFDDVDQDDHLHAR